MEPLNAIAHYKSDTDIEIWAGTQSPNYAAHQISKALGLRKEDFTIHNYHMGGGNGRRYFTDPLFEAVLLSRKLKRPVKMVRSRQDEVQHCCYHPLRKDYYEAGLDEEGNILAMKADVVTTHEWGGFEAKFYYGHKHLKAKSKFYENRLLTCGSWRSVVLHSDIFPREIFIDELAHAAGKDPLRFRIEQIGRPYPSDHTINHDTNHVERMDRLRRIHGQLYKMVGELSEWDRPRPKGVGLGVAAHAHHEISFASMVAEVDMRDGKLKVTRVFCVADVGLQINPSLVNTQIESSIIWALSPLLKGGSM
jgi:isoquinoline 1-oxidoreductase beta subunit